MKRNIIVTILFVFLCCISCSTTTDDAENSAIAEKIPTIVSGASQDQQGEFPENTFGVVAADSLKNKIIVGYQGWFACPGDGSEVDSWFHWDHGSTELTDISVDFWPATNEFGKDELCLTGLVDTLGNPLYAYSAYNQLTVKRHFLWMAEHDIDGVELQRFANELKDPRYKSFRNKVLDNVIQSAEDYGRVFYIQYDWLASDTMLTIKADWRDLVNKGVTENSRYLHHDGLPVVGLFGIGYEFKDFTAEEIEDLLSFFQDNPDEKYRAAVLGGVPFEWRELHFVNNPNSPYKEIMQDLDIISPWAVGVYGSGGQAYERHQNVTLKDIQLVKSWGNDYMPVIFPGFSWKNSKPQYPLNQIPRRGGQFLWQQAYSLLDLDVDMLYVAMFDEFDEGTNIHKSVETADQLPSDKSLISNADDGYRVPDDWYLEVTSEIAKVLHGDGPLTVDFPLQNTLKIHTQGGWDETRSAIGQWDHIDKQDGSYQTLTITQSSENKFLIQSSDEAAPPCGNEEIFVEGQGEKLGNLIIIPKYTARCRGSTTGGPWSFYNVLTYDMASDTVTDVWDVVWERQ